MSTEKEFDYAKSTKIVGQLYPVLKAKTGEIIDGFTRKNAMESWREEIREDIDTKEKILAARLVANKCRRMVTLNEVKEWINQLAEIYLQQGKKPGEISSVIAENTGYKEGTVQAYLDAKYKDITKSEAGKTGRSAQLDWAPTLPLTEVRQVLGEETFQKVREKIEEETAKKLLTDKNHLAEAAKGIIPTESIRKIQKVLSEPSTPAPPPPSPQEEEKKPWTCDICLGQQSPYSAPVTVQMCPSCRVKFTVWKAEKDYAEFTKK